MEQQITYSENHKRIWDDVTVDLQAYLTHKEELVLKFVNKKTQVTEVVQRFDKQETRKIAATLRGVH